MRVDPPTLVVGEARVAPSNGGGVVINGGGDSIAGPPAVAVPAPGAAAAAAATAADAAGKGNGGKWSTFSCRVPLVANVGIGMRLRAKADGALGAVEVASVAPGSVAAAGGVAEGDELTSVADRQLPLPLSGGDDGGGGGGGGGGGRHADSVGALIASVAARAEAEGEGGVVVSVQQQQRAPPSSCFLGC